MVSCHDNNQFIKLKNIEVNNGNFIKKCIGENNEIIYPNKKNFFPFFFSPFKVLYEDKLGIHLIEYLNEKNSFISKTNSKSLTNKIIDALKLLTNNNKLEALQISKK